MSAIFSHANEDELIGHNPAKNPSKLVRVPNKKTVEVFTLSEEQQILETVKHFFKEYYPFVLFVFRTGVREGEAVSLKPEDLDFQSRYAWIGRSYTAGHLEHSPKSGKSRKVDLSQDLAGVLKDHLALQEAEAALQQKPKPTWLFTSPQGQLIRSNNFRDRVWRPVLKRLGLRYRNVHAIRHTYATRMIMAGANLVYVQKQLGHSTIQLMVDTYTHWIEEVERGSQLEVDRLVGNSQFLSLDSNRI